MEQFKRSNYLDWQKSGTTVMASNSEVYIAPPPPEVKESHYIRVLIAPEVHARLARPSPCPDTTSVVETAMQMALGKRPMQGAIFMYCDLSISPLPLPPKNEYILYITNKGDSCVRFFVNREQLLKEISMAIELPHA